MELTVTTSFACAFGVLMLVLWMLVTKTRAALDVSIGEAGQVHLHEWVRRHGNFIEWIPMTLVLMALAELQGAGAIWLWISGALALAGRLVHPFGLRADNAGHPLRIAGNLGNIISVVILLILLAMTVLAG